jgi:uncharacterized repeat protein (TIGR01451 family)
MNRHSSLCCGLLSLLVLLAGTTPTLAQANLYSVANNDNMIRRIDPSNAATLSAVPMGGNLTMGTVVGANGLARHPITGEMWAMLQVAGVGATGRTLGKVDPLTGDVTVIGDTGDFFAGIAFDCNGNLYGVTGDGANVAESLFLLNQTNGQPTLVGALGNGDFGEAIGFNPTDNLMYHASGFNTVIFESFDPTSPPFTFMNISIVGTALENEEPGALAFEASTGNLLWKQGSTFGMSPPPQLLFRVTTAGVEMLVGTFDHRVKGLAYDGPTGCPVDASITKSDSPDPVDAGNTITYTIMVTFNGAVANSVTLSDMLPMNTTFFSLTAPMGWTCTTPAVGATGAVSCTIPAHPGGGAMASFTLVVTTTGAAGGTTVSNTASVALADTDTNPADNTATTTTTVNAVADLAITKSDSPDPVAAGSNITYAIVVTNNGPSAASNASWSDTLPANTTFQSLTSAAGWTCTTPGVGAAGTVSCSNPSLAAGAMDSFTLVVQTAMAAAGTTISNTATVTSATTDPIPADNSASTSTTVQSATNTDFTIATQGTGPIVLTVRPGESASFPVDITPTPAGTTFGADVTVTCMTDPDVGTCAANPNLILAGSGATTVTVTITPHLAFVPPAPGSPLLWLWLTVFAVALLAAGWAGGRRVPQLRYAASFGLALLLLSLVGMQAACGSRGQRVSGPHQVTVTATSGGISHSTTATYNVSK